MILVIERDALQPAEPHDARGHECSLQQTLRRMGVYAAREPKRRKRPTTPSPTEPTVATAPGGTALRSHA